MNKPLGEPWTKADKTGWRPVPGYLSPGKGAQDLSSADFYRRQKRFTDAELAAEAWCAAESRTAFIVNSVSGLPTRGIFQDHADLSATFLRFATHPHYDEETT